MSFTTNFIENAIAGQTCELVPVKLHTAETSTYSFRDCGRAEYKVLEQSHPIPARSDRILVHETTIRLPEKSQASEAFSKSSLMETMRNPSAATTETIHGATLRSKARGYRRATPVKSACIQCRRRKTRCSGQRPTCQRCLSSGTRCLWDTCDGLTKASDFRHKLHELVSQLSVLETLIDQLRSGTDNTAALLLAKLRLGVATEDLVRPYEASTRL